MPVNYSLMEGLTALGAYAVLIIANSYLCDLLRKDFEDWPKRHQIFEHFLFFGILGASLLACRVGNIIIRSEICIGISGAIGLALSIVIFVPQVRAFDQLIHKIALHVFSNNFRIEFLLYILIIVPWIGLFISSLLTPNNWKFLSMITLLIFFLFLMLCVEAKLSMSDRPTSGKIERDREVKGGDP